MDGERIENNTHASIKWITQSFQLGSIDGERITDNPNIWMFLIVVLKPKTIMREKFIKLNLLFTILYPSPIKWSVYIDT